MPTYGSIFRVVALFRLFSVLGIVLLCPALALGQVCVPAPAGMIAWWPMDEDGGTTVADAAGSNAGTHVGAPTPEPGQVGRALRFAGSSFVAVKDSDLWAFGSSDFTIELWANFATPGGGSVGSPSHIFISNDESPGTANKWFFALGGGFLEFHINGPGIGDQFLPLVPFSPQLGQWYHLAVKRQGITYTIYVNGEPLGVGDNPHAIPNPNALLTIGEAEGLFHMNGLLDEVTIYNRALANSELKAIFEANSAGKCKPPKITTTVLTAGQLARPYEQPLLAEFGTPPYTWSVGGGALPPGISLDSAGILSGSPLDTGTFQFVASLLDANGKTADASLSLEVLLVAPLPEIRVNMVGNIPVPGRTIEYFIVVENIGQSVAQNIISDEFLQPWFAFVNSIPPPDTVFRLPKIFPIGSSGEYDAVLRWSITQLAPGEFRIFSYRVTVHPALPLGIPVSGLLNVHDHVGIPVSGDLNAHDHVETPTGCGLILLDCYGTKGCFVGFDDDCITKCQCCHAKCTLCLPADHNCGISCVKPFEDIPLNPLALSQVSSSAAPALDQRSAPMCASDTQETQGPTDPNEKLVVAKRFVRPEQTLVYPIHFENIGTIEARDVFVTDVLDPALDESTLRILTPHGASFNASTRLLKWDLLNINLPPGETGNLLVAITPKPNLPSGTVIRNKATIQFEVFAPLDTNQVETVIDTTPPTCAVNGLPAETHKLSFPVSWVASDPIGEVETVSVLVSVDGGAFAPFLTDAKVSSAVFTGSRGHSYGFLCIARDTAGNTEVQNPVAEAQTLLTTTFTDVPESHGFFTFIEALASAGITGGCATSPPQFCPEAGVTRDQMAVFLLRGIHGAVYQPPGATGAIFADVPTSQPFATWIEQLAREGITSGCSTTPPRYCPDAGVTRGEMAVFLLRAKHGAGYQPPDAIGTMFTDVPLGHPFGKWIEELAREGITSGCGPMLYCPDATTTRGQMAVFLVRAFQLSL